MVHIVKAEDLRPHRARILLYGPPGVGKTVLSTSLPGKTLIVNTENGATSVAGKEDVWVTERVTNLKELDDVVWGLDDTEWDNIVLDSISESMLAGLEAEAAKKGKNLVELAHYQRVGMALRRIVRNLVALDANIVITSLSTTTQEGVVKPALTGQLTQIVVAAMDHVWYMGMDGGGRFLLLQGSEKYVCKTRCQWGKSVPTLVENPSTLDVTTFYSDE